MNPLYVRLEACKTLPTMPGVALELLRLCKSDDSDARTIAAALARDPALAAKILRTSNSALYRRRTEVTTIQQAVVVLGSSTVATLALSFSLVVNKGQAGFDHTSFWAQSLFSAVAARSLARRFSLNQDELFLAGLMQDLGALALATAVPEYGPLALDAGKDHNALAQRERKDLGLHHGEVSAWLARRWKLPDYIAQCSLASHTSYHDLWEPLISRCVATSSWIASIWTSGDAPLATREAALRASAWLQMERAVFHEVVADVVKEVPDLGKLLDIAIEDTREVEQIANQARAAMAVISFRLSEADKARLQGASEG